MLKSIRFKIVITFLTLGMLGILALGITNIIELENLNNQIINNTNNVAEIMNGYTENMKVMTTAIIGTFIVVMIIVGSILAKVKGEVINLTKKEFDVLKYLASQPGQVVTREMLLREVWEYEEYVGAIRTIDVTMNRIRDKIEKDKANPKILITKRGVGYYVTDKN